MEVSLGHQPRIAQPHLMTGSEGLRLVPPASLLRVALQQLEPGHVFTQLRRGQW